jgi:hypothetical protein
MRKALLLLGLLLVSLPLLPKAAAQTPGVPGSGHGHLIDQHAAAGVNCTTCHRAMCQGYIAGKNAAAEMAKS